ncbi:MAG: glycosyltransferase family 1 protein [Calditrichia bacterium]
MDTGKKQTIYINGRFLTQPISGVQRYAGEIIKALDVLIEKEVVDTSLYQIVILCPNKNIHEFPELQNIPIVRTGRLGGHAWEQLELPFFIKRNTLFCPGNTAPILTLLFGAKTIVTVHSLSYLYFAKAYSLFYRLWYRMMTPAILRLANAVITVSETEKKIISEHFPGAGSRLFAIQNGGLPVSCSAENSTGRKTDKEPYILYVGALTRSKNFQGAMEAVRILNKTVKAKLVVAGSAGKAFNYASMVDHAQNEGLTEFKGQINNLEDLIELYRGAACFVFPSFYEASPLPPIEAMACGCPVIVSDIPALRERCGDAALYCNPGDPEDIARKIEYLIKNPDTAARLIKRGKERAKIFDWENCALKTFEIISAPSPK